ncbi:hypothetical protein [Streptomyces sp. NPDC048473]|uniref:hypothetical protein n=1 Tax=unclassified Streptomyces TaxID=2593676 RepID=UPI00371ED971
MSASRTVCRLVAPGLAAGSVVAVVAMPASADDGHDRHHQAYSHVVLGGIQYNGPGRDDYSNRSLNGEWVATELCCPAAWQRLPTHWAQPMAAPRAATAGAGQCGWRSPPGSPSHVDRAGHAIAVGCCPERRVAPEPCWARTHFDEAPRGRGPIATHDSATSLHYPLRGNGM